MSKHVIIDISLEERLKSGCERSGGEVATTELSQISEAKTSTASLFGPKSMGCNARHEVNWREICENHTYAIGIHREREHFYRNKAVSLPELVGPH